MGHKEHFHHTGRGATGIESHGGYLEGYQGKDGNWVPAKDHRPSHPPYFIESRVVKSKNSDRNLRDIKKEPKNPSQRIVLHCYI